MGHRVLRRHIRGYSVYIYPKKGRQAYRGIKHDVPFINIPKVPREVLKNEGEARGFLKHFPRDLANVND